MKLILFTLIFITTFITSAQSDYQSIDGEPGALSNCPANQDLLKIISKKEDLRTYFLRKVDEAQASWNVLNNMSIVSSSLLESSSPSETVDLLSYLMTNSQSISPLTTSSKHCSDDLQTILHSYSACITSEQKFSFYTELDMRITALKMCYERYSESMIGMISSLDAEIERLSLQVDEDKCK